MSDGIGSQVRLPKAPAKKKPKPPTSVKSRRGRPKGSLNKATPEIRAFFRNFFEGDEYRESLKQRILAGDANHMEVLGHYYGYGRPKERVQLDAPPRGAAIAALVSFLDQSERRALFDLAKRLRDATPRAIEGVVVSSKKVETKED